MGDEVPCENCAAAFQKLSDELVGALSTIRQQNGRIGKLTREDPDKKLRDHAQFQRGERLFKVWQRATGHSRSRWTITRFKQALPFLEVYEDDLILRAIEGIAYDPMTAKRKNGAGEERFDGWGTLFKDDDAFERYCNRAPLNWRDNLLEHAEEVAGRR